MIKTAEEFIRLRQSELKDDQERATSEPADLNVWIDVINKYPEFKTWVIHNKTIQIEILETLVNDKDANVRCDIARKRKINESIFNTLSIDSDENVRHALISNTALTIEQLKKINVDNSAWLTNAVYDKIKNASR
jgi:intein/homing endonuclease